MINFATSSCFDRSVLYKALVLTVFVCVRREEFIHWVELLPDTQTPSWLGLPSNAEKVLLTTQGMSVTAMGHLLINLPVFISLCFEVILSVSTGLHHSTLPHLCLGRNTHLLECVCCNRAAHTGAGVLLILSLQELYFTAVMSPSITSTLCFLFVVMLFLVLRFSSVPLERMSSSALPLCPPVAGLAIVFSKPVIRLVANLTQQL